MRKRDKVRKLEQALVQFCVDNNVMITTGYSLGQDSRVGTEDGYKFSFWEVCPSGIKYTLHDTKYSRRKTK